MPAATESAGLGDSPLVTPRKEADEEEVKATPAAQPSSLMQAMNQVIRNPTAVRPQPAANAEEDTKKRGWQERLEKLKAKK